METKEKIKVCNNNNCMFNLKCWSYLKGSSFNKETDTYINMADFYQKKDGDDYVSVCNNFVKN